MVTLLLDARDFGFHSFAHVRANYNTLDEALAQARHNLATGKQRPIRIEDEHGQVLWQVDSET